MISNVLKTPCPGCPFGYHKDAVLYLREEMLKDVTTTDSSFACHRTVEDTGGPEGGEERLCAGWIIYQLVNGCGELLRIMGRIGMIDEDEMLENQELVVTDWDELVERHRSGGKNS